MTEAPVALCALADGAGVQGAQTAARGRPGRHLAKTTLNPTGNRLIDLLPPPDRRRLLSIAEPLTLRFGEILSQHGAPVSHVHLPAGACISLLVAVDGRDGLQVGMVGSEGVLGASLALGVGVSPWQAVVHGEGPAWRIGAAAFRRELVVSPALRRCVGRYVIELLVQLSRSATCMRFHQIGPRLARCLLMTQDRAQADRFGVTHEVLAGMLGVRRVGITLAAGRLQRRRLITYHRGRVGVLDRAGLEAAACSCYAEDRRSYRYLLAPGRRPPES